MLKPLWKALIPTVALIAFVGIIGCGKKTKDKESVVAKQEPLPQMTEREEFLSKQQMVCDRAQTCPNYIAKLVVFDKSSTHFCTGFLVGKDRVATSSSCLRQQSCEGSVFVFFQGATNRPAIRVGCKKILTSSKLEGSEPPLWREDVSFLELEKEVPYRKQVDFSREGLSNHREYIFWSVEQMDDSTGFIRRQDCEAIHNSYLNPLVTSPYSPNMIFSGCSLKEGNSGGPILDSKGKVRGMASVNISAETLKYLEGTGLLIGPLRQMFHATNFSCATTLNDSNTADEAECSKSLDTATLDLLRSEILSLSTAIDRLRKKLEDKFEGLSQYFRYGVKLQAAQADSYKAEIFPRCFKDISKWIGTLNTTRNAYVFDALLPNVVLKRKMDSYGRGMAIEEENGTTKFTFQFSPRHLANTRKSLVYMWNDSISLTFPNLSESCQ